MTALGSRSGAPRRDATRPRWQTGYLHEAGFTEIHAEVIPVTTEVVRRCTSLDRTTGFKREQLPPEQRAAGEAQLRQLCEGAVLPCAWGAVGFIGATARRPAPPT